MVQRSASVGFKLHTGWAACVAVARKGEGIEVLQRARIELLPDDNSVPRFVYHEAAELDAASAAETVRRAERTSRKLADAALAKLIEDLRGKNITAFVCGVITGSAGVKPGTELCAILQSHPLIHAAEGALFQSAVIGACERLGLGVTTVRERDLWDAAAKVCGCDTQMLRKQVDALRKIVGAPWTADEKTAAAAAIVASGTIGSRRS
jgi:hypothetical protein